MNYNKYVFDAKSAEDFIRAILDKFSKRQDICEPLTKTLGDYSNVLFLRAVRNVMFERFEMHIAGKPVKIWVLKQYLGKPPKTEEAIKFFAMKAMSNMQELRKMIGAKNHWKNYSAKKEEKFNISFEYKVFDKDANVSVINYPQFRERYLPKLIVYLNCHNQNLIESLLYSIYRAIDDAFKTAVMRGYNKGKTVGKEEANEENRELFRQLYRKITEEENNLIKLKAWMSEEVRKFK